MTNATKSSGSASGAGVPAPPASRRLVGFEREYACSACGDARRSWQRLSACPSCGEPLAGAVIRRLALSG